MRRRLHKTLVDYLVIAISPALIMALVGSLVFFLIEVFYQGAFQGRLRYIFALFVIGAVLIGRISIEDGRERAALFAVPLAIAILLAINKFVQFQGGMFESFSFLINCGLIGIIWWSADKLTWDCTLIDDSEEDSGEGLLQSVGLEHGDRLSPEQMGGEPPNPHSSLEPADGSWWERFIERRRRPHAPGVWVVYFSLAALPLFGIGQLFIPEGNLGARQYAFDLLFVYTASGLGLLLSTSFLGLRRYLRQRGEEMPLGMVGLWLTIGSVLIVGVMMAAMLLPRPNAEYPVSELGFRIGSPDQKSSRHGTGRDGVKDDKPWARGEKDDRAATASVSSDKSDSKTSSKDKGTSKDEKASASKDGKDTSKQADHDNSAERGDQSREGKPRDDQEGRDAVDRSESGDWQQSSDASDTKNQEAGKAQAPDGAERQADFGQGSSGSPPLHAFEPLKVPLDAAALLVALVKWTLYGVLGLLGIWWLWKNKDAILAAVGNLAQWLADFWNRLFGGARREASHGGDETHAPAPPPRRFADFTDPFATGVADRYPPEELVRYTFEAMEAWARDHGRPRPSEQTPHEFARCVAAHAAWLTDDSARLAELYCQVAYARGTLPRSRLACLSRCWQGMMNGWVERGEPHHE